MLVLMRLGNNPKNGRPVWQEKISPLEPQISPFETLKIPPLMFKRLGSMHTF